MTLQELLPVIPVTAVKGDMELEVHGVTVDSRHVETGYVFVAVVGERTDGHTFLEEARKRGAIAVVSQQPPREVGMSWVQTPEARKAAGLLAAAVAGHPAKRLSLIGITGTNGKSTTAFLLDSILQALAPPSAMFGTIVARIGDAAEPTVHTTPEAPELQDFLARAVSSGCGFGTLEVSSHGLALDRLEGTEFACAVFTNLSRDHLDFHRDMEDYFAAKRLLFDRYLRPGALSVVGIDDGYGSRLAESLRGPVVTYGFSKDASLRVESVSASFAGLTLHFRDRGVGRYLESPLVGRHNVSNLLASFAAAVGIGFEADAVLDIFSSAKGAPGRYERIDEGQSFQVIVDYAHTDDALRQLLETTMRLPHGRIITVFGCGGDRDRSKRPLMGAVAARLSDAVVLTSDNPRGEDPMSIIREIELGTRSPHSKAAVNVESDRRAAIALALSMARAADVVLVAGRGHEPWQKIGGRLVPFDDREVIREILRGRSEKARGTG